MTVYLAYRHDAQIEDLPVWSMCFHFDAADFVAFQAVEKRVVDRWIPCQFGEALRFEPRDGGTEEFVRGRIRGDDAHVFVDRKSTRLNSSHSQISYAVFCLKKKK